METRGKPLERNYIISFRTRSKPPERGQIVSKETGEFQNKEQTATAPKELQKIRSSSKPPKRDTRTNRSKRTDKGANRLEKTRDIETKKQTAQKGQANLRTRSKPPERD